MVGIVLVSHSRPLALAVQDLVRAMSGPALPLAIAAGTGENHAELGTDAVEISEAIIAVQNSDGVLVLMDMGSAILSSETALDLMEEKDRQNVRFCAAPFVEGAVASGVTANLGASLDEVHAEAMAALKQKLGALKDEESVDPSSPSVAAGNQSNGAKQLGHSIQLVVRNANGLHARPAARLIQESKPFAAEISARNLTKQRGPVSIKSLSSLALLEILQGNKIEISAYGPDAIAALEKIQALARDNFGEASSGDGLTTPPSYKAESPPIATTNPVPISPGLAIGRAFFFTSGTLEIPQEKIEDVATESARLKESITKAERILAVRREQMTRSVGGEHAAIYDAQILALQDPELTENALKIIAQEHKNAACAWDEANRRIVKRYRALENIYLRERATDIADVGRLVLTCLGITATENLHPDEPSILITDDLTPQQVSALKKDKILGVILLDGGPTAHSSILLKALGVPALVQARAAFSGSCGSAPACLAFDGMTGDIWLDPVPTLADEIRNRQAKEHRRHAEEALSGQQPATTLDGHRIEIFANLGQVSEAAAAAHAGADGVGLLRTEFLFLNRKTPPSEQEQFEALREIASTFKHRPLTVRTLDIGGDKQVPYLPMPKEENPFLGVRALRLCFQRDDLFTTQLRAILRAGDGHDLKLMFPMVADLSNLTQARARLDRVHEDLRREGLAHRWPIELGIMVEIPSAALLADSLAEHVDFFSIGTNDLTQYALAADRGNPSLGSYQDALHPGVLRLIDLVVRGARKRDRLVAVCGEAASDEASALIFAGLGVRELSVSAARIPSLKALVRTQELATWQDLASRALECHSADEVRQLAAKALP